MLRTEFCGLELIGLNSSKTCINYNHKFNVLSVAVLLQIEFVFAHKASIKFLWWYDMD